MDGINVRIRQILKQPPRWWGIHLTFQLFFAGPLIYTGIYFGLDVVKKLGAGNFNDTHKVRPTRPSAHDVDVFVQKIGLSLLILYTAQLSIGLFIHFVKMKSLFRGRPPQNYFHAILGLAILALAAYQVIIPLPVSCQF